MAEILCGVLSGSDSSASADACDPATRAARRRRMEIRRLRIVSGVAAAPDNEPLAKKRRLGFSPSTPSPLTSSPSPSPSPCSSPIRPPLDLNHQGEGVEGVVDETPAASLAVKPHDEKQEMATGATVPVDAPIPSPATRVSNRCPGYGMTSVCGRRREMEDAVSICPVFHKADIRQSGCESPFHFFGVFDGHGCSHVADSCKERMHEVIAAELHTAIPATASQWEESMRRSFSRMDAEVVQHPGDAVFQRRRLQQQQNEGGPHPQQPAHVVPPPRCRCELQAASAAATSLSKCDHVGSTAVVAVLTAEHIVLANCGDSRAVLCRDGVAIPLSVDHKPDRPDELRRIQEAGGRVIYWDGARVLGVLAMSRAIGDYHLKPFVTSDPEVTVTERTDGDECLVIASDGLWDVVTCETACDVARMCLKAGDTGADDAGTASSAVVDDDGPVAMEAQGRDRRGGSDAACVDAAMLLTKLALARGTADNVSVVVVDLRNKARRGARAGSGQSSASDSLSSDSKR